MVYLELNLCRIRIPEVDLPPLRAIFFWPALARKIYPCPFWDDSPFRTSVGQATTAAIAADVHPAAILAPIL